MLPRSIDRLFRAWRGYRLAILFVIALVAVVLFGSLAGPIAVGQSRSDNPLLSLVDGFTFPRNTTPRLLETVGLFIAGILFCIALDRWFKRSTPNDTTPLTKQARRLGTLKIGYPEGMTNLEVLRERGFLETRLKPFGVMVTWTGFLSASSLIESLSNGSIDFCGGGGTASVFSQAAEHVFVRVAKEKYTAPKGQAILVPEDSPIRTLAELKGQKIAFDRGSSAHYVLIRALAKVGLELSDIEPVYATQPEALVLFRRGEIDAWVVWVPYSPTETRTYPGGRSITDLESIFGENASLEVPTYYYAVPELVRDYPDVLKVILEEVNEAGAWAKQQELDAARRMAEHHELDPAIVANLEQRASERAIVPIDDRSLTALQHQANLFRDLKLIPKRVNVRDGTYTLQTKQNWTY